MTIGRSFIDLLNTPVVLPSFLQSPSGLRFDVLWNARSRLERALSRTRCSGTRRTRDAQRMRNPKLFSLEGTVRTMTSGGFSIEGDLFHVNEDTFVVGELRDAVSAKVKGLYLPDGKRVATAVVIKECA